MEHYENLKLLWMVIAKTNGEVCDLKNSCPTDKKPFYQIYFSGLGPGNFFPLPIDYFIKKRNGKLFVEESYFLDDIEKEAGSLDEAKREMLGLMEKLEDDFEKSAQKKGHNLNVYGWIGEPDINELGKTAWNW
ncbi:hypothetical protein GOV13_05575 [Candidatus Pacearchaeota archaeon]|nr:hypothetical protein [Candidatus Pacearchaeota archaeon]